MSIAIRLARSGLGITLPILLGAASAAAQTRGAVSASYELATERPTVNGPVFVTLTIRNGLSEPIVVDAGSNYTGYGAFEGTIRRPDGSTEAGPKFHPSETVAKKMISIDSFGSASVSILLNKWFDFSLPGQYAVDVRTKKPVRTASGVELPSLNAGQVAIDVGPRDPVGLRQTCDALDAQVRNAQGEHKIEALWTLTHIDDPIAVEYLDRLLWDYPRLAPELIAALEKIADEPAVDALLRRLHDPDEELRAMVRQALRVVSQRTGAPVIRQRIDGALR